MALIDVDWKPGNKDLRIFATLFVVFSGLVGAVLYFKHSMVLLPKILWIAGPIVGLLGIVLPRLVWPLYVAMMAVALPIGMVVSTVLMTVIYFLVLTPIGWLIRLLGHDAMGRKRDSVAKTYWIERPATIKARRYFRQF